MSRFKTPLRYPGGKQKLSPFVLEVLQNNEMIGGDYVEPYAGGGGVALELLLNRHVERIHLNDSSLPIYAFWKSILDHPEKFCRKIASASLTVEEWKRHKDIVKHSDCPDEFDLGFSTFYLNRCNRSGVLSGGLIGGLEQNGKWKMDARFSRNDLICRVEAIASRRDSITVRNWDAERFILQYIPTLPRKTFVYCDPPYFKKSNRLYLNFYKESDHERIANIIQNGLSRKWIVSYDGVVEIIRYYAERKSFLYDLQYNASTVYKGKEVFIFSDDVTIPSKSSLSFIDKSLQAMNHRPTEPVTGNLFPEFPVRAQHT